MMLVVDPQMEIGVIGVIGALAQATFMKIHNRTWVVHHVTPEALRGGRNMYDL